MKFIQLILKQENILLDERGHIKLVDFGFAKYTNDRYKKRRNYAILSFIELIQCAEQRNT